MLNFYFKYFLNYVHIFQSWIKLLFIIITIIIIIIIIIIVIIITIACNP